ncbi:MAG: type VI secretion system tip protein TssI/VgrG [Candidatus Dactylopiibacterium sp.]|nr:type VI secretion system tip protein TssI/VgrG [Candidatus Dactylopiibacterium sp.]
MAFTLPGGRVAALQAYHLHIPALGLPGVLSVRQVRVREALGEPYELTLTVTTPHAVDLLAALNGPGTFTVSPVDALGYAAGLSFEEATLTPLRRWAGVVRQIARVALNADEAVHEITLAARVACLADFTDTRLFQNQTIPDVIRAVLQDDLGLLADAFRFNTLGTYPVLEHITQYNESSLAFITRLCETSGLFYYFEQTDTHETVIFADDASHYLSALSAHLYRADAGLESAGRETVKTLEVRARPINARTARLDHNYRNSGGADLIGTQTAPPRQAGLSGRDYRWGSHHKDPAQGRAAAQLAFEIQHARQIQATGEANIVRFAPAQIFRTDGPPDPLAESGWVIVSVEHQAARNHAWVSRFNAIPAQRTYRLAQTTPKPTIAGTLPARITSPSHYRNAYLNEQGLYRVTYLFDQRARDKQWPPAGSSRLMRLARPYAGDTWGLHFPLIDGTEVQVAFQNGDIDRPYIAHALHDQTHPDHVTHANNTRNILRTPQNNKLRLEDRDGAQHIKLSTEYGKSQLNLGHLVDAERQKRGEGFELRTDGWGAVRAAKGLFISADAQPRAQGEQLDMQPALELLRQAEHQMEALNQLAQTAKAQLAELDEQKALHQQTLSALKQPGLLVSAPTGMAWVSGKNLQMSAAQSVTLTAARNAEIGVLKDLTVAAGQMISLFAHRLGMKLFAAKGAVEIQAQSDAMSLHADQDLTLSSVKGEVLVSASKALTLACGGAYIRLADGQITVAGPGALELRNASVLSSGPASLKPAVPGFEQTDLSLDERFILVARGAGDLLARQRYRITLKGGAVDEGVTDEHGRTSLLMSRLSDMGSLELLSEGTSHERER